MTDYNVVVGQHRDVMKNSKIKIYSFVGISIFLGLYLLQIYILKNREQVSSITSEHSLTDPIETEDASTVAQTKRNTEHRDVTSMPAGFTMSDWVIAEDWMGQRGYISKKDAGVYQSYSDETLLQLAKQGDLIALDRLTKISFANRNVAAGIGYLNVAARFGSTAALDQLTAFSEPHFSPDESEKTRRLATMETLAIAKVIELRGDAGLSAVSINSFKKSYERQLGQPLQLSADEDSLVQSRAMAIYSKLESERTKLGLPPFDNTRPSEVDKIYSEN
ncbi:MAG: hypothetical protein EOP48_09910 [Sphingobacteriales bacterium]|nr:MAG: hypothetical protein EOP48_09910 [Sphingobacteriales bacterium]